MRESEAQITRLQELLDASVERAGAFLRSSLEMPERSLSARQLGRHLTGTRTVSLATVTARGAPRVAPVSSVFVHGRYYIPTVVDAARSRHLRARPALSLTDYEGNHLAIIIHGNAALIGLDDPEFAEADELFTLGGNQGPRQWGGGGPLYIRADPDVMYTHARDPSRYPE